MSRSGYSDDCENLQLYRAAVERAASGKRGQAFFRDLIGALDEMPVKRLIADALQAPDGEVCALGALGVKRGIDVQKLDPHEPHEVGQAFNIAQSLAAEVTYMNDETYDSKSPEDRWTLMRAWAAEQLRAAPPASALAAK